MKTAFATWNNRIAPVFDIARTVHLIISDAGNIIDREEATLPIDLPAKKASCLAEWEVDSLVCGAISRPMQMLVTSYGIHVVPFVAGELQEVIQAWLNGKLEDGSFNMPGCCGRRRRTRCGNKFHFRS